MLLVPGELRVGGWRVDGAPATERVCGCQVLHTSPSWVPVALATPGALGRHACCLCVQGGTLFEILDNTEPLPRDPLAPFRMSIIDKYKDMGAIAMGKSEAGIVRKNDRLYVMPNKWVPAVPAVCLCSLAQPARLPQCCCFQRSSLLGTHLRSLLQSHVSEPAMAITICCLTYGVHPLLNLCRLQLPAWHACGKSAVRGRAA